MAESVNTFLDNLVSLAARILDFPLYLLLPAFLLCAWLLKLLIDYFLKRIHKSEVFPLKYYYPFILLAAFAFSVDHKFRTMEKNMDQLNLKLIHSFGAGTDGISGFFPGSSNYRLEGLADDYPSLVYQEQRLNPATELLIIRKSDPEAIAFISIIDLDFPRLEICITPELKEKYLTSTFAREAGCDVAINGEAGESMKQGCTLGEWTGNLVVNGRALLLEDSDIRPFLSFDINNKARYFKSSITDRENGPEKYNTIWGRFDLLTDGKYTPPQLREKPYARTVMAINREGNRLYLLIADGKRPEYSMGLTYRECADILLSLGAWNGMACDQGGSSCMYLKNIDGIINRPADSDGYERYVYTHFGVKVN